MEVVINEYEFEAAELANYSKWTAKAVANPQHATYREVQNEIYADLTANKDCICPYVGVKGKLGDFGLLLRMGEIDVRFCNRC